ncbi:MAG: LUD domain-containing protein [Pseudonocardia sp.]|uniref:LutC/YkgG family protein n=1 Tax=Pseudonocardia sp. TaxID=60912 RepID=UPI001AC7F2CF|nr:LUD domain-containing protein [Pseudonocardia sp.]MBN9100215.1 LUD domain-containing protein [Pseudonocardia sp.]
MSAREDVLRRIRGANAAAGNPPPPEVPRDYHRTGALAPGSPAVLELLADRLVDYKATVLDAGDDVPAAIRTALAGVDGPVLVPPGLPDGWCPDGTEDAGFAPAELDGYAAVVTGCAAACAVTGTIALDGSPDQGRRAITLVPDVHVCVVRADQVVETVPELLARLTPTRPTTFVSGPSATSDIELERVEGVHGPRTLIVVLAG